MTFGLQVLRVLMTTLSLRGSAPLPHADLRASDPARNSHLTTPPKRITLWFTARPEVPLSHVRLVGPGGNVALGKLAADTGNALRADIAGPVPDGTYKVVWQAASADGHPVSGEFSFMVATDPAMPMHTEPLPSSPSLVTEPPPPLGARFLRLWEFIGLLLVLGVIVFLHGVLPPLAARGVHTADASQQARGVGEVGAVIYVLAAAFRLVREVSAVLVPDGSPAATLSAILGNSSWGHGWLLGVIGALLVIVGLWLSMRRVAAGTPTALTGAFAMVLSPGLTGHAAAAKWFIASVTLDALHVASIGSWLGTLAIVVLIGIPAMARVKDGNADAAVSALVNSFHPIALLSAPMAVFAGLGSAALRLGSLGALTSSRYGEVLTIKVVGVALLASVGAWNSMRSRRRLGTPQATLSIRRTAVIEVVLAALVLWATTDLIATPVPTELLRP